MKLYGARYCDFVVWRKDDVFIQRISCNVTFITEALDKIPPFIKLCILPELVGKWFTWPAELSHGHVVSVDPINEEASVEPLEGPSDMTVDATVSATVTSDILTSIQDSLQTPAAEDTNQDSDDALWCYCQQNMQEELVGCDNRKIQWLHLSCLQLTLSQLPKGKWYCPECHKDRYQSTR